MVRPRRRFGIARTIIGLSVIALVLVGALGLVVIVQPPSLIRPVTTTVTGTTTFTSTTTTTVMATTPCPESTTVQYQGIPVNFSYMAVLLMQPNTTATMCVTYQGVWADNPQLSLPSKNSSYNFLPSGVEKLTCVETNQAAGCAGQESHSFEIFVNPAVIQEAASPDYVTVVYTILALPNATGFYDEAFLRSCEAPRLAVGFGAAQVNGSDFAAVPAHSCPAQDYWPCSMTVSGMNVTYVNIGWVDWPSCLPNC